MEHVAMNSLHEAGRCTGAAILLAALAGLIAIQAWGALAFIVVGAAVGTWLDLRYRS